MIFVKKDCSVKIALDARALTQAIEKDIRNANFRELLDMVAEKSHTEKGEHGSHRLI